MTAELRVVRGSQVGERLALPERATLVVGRMAGADLRLVGDAVSRQQFALERRPDGAWRMRDLASANGTLLNGRPVIEATLQDGDRIAVGDVECEFRWTGPPDDDRTALRLDTDEPDSSFQIVEAADAASDDGGLAVLGAEWLAELATVLAGEGRPDALCHRVLASALTAMGAERGAVLWREPGRVDFVPLAVRRGAADPPELRPHLPRTTLVELARGNRGLLVRLTRPRLESAVLAPVLLREGAAVLYLGRDTPPFGAAGAHTLAAIGRLLGAALDRARADDARADALRRLRLLVEGADDMVFTCDDEGRLTYCNHWPGDRTAGGDALVGQPLVDALPVADRARVLAELDRVLQGAERAVVETRWQLAGGPPVPVRLSLSPLRNPNGAIVGARGLARDQREVLALRAAGGRTGRPLLGESPALATVLRQAARVARTAVPVLITGESGTGKELVARLLHDQGPRASGPFVAVNCGALPESLLESELFGHVRGAFTGADRPRPGLFVSADGGTLFLDEIGEMPLPMQARLLRVLEERVVRPVGADAGVPVDVRVIAATNRDLAALAAAGRFRDDLRFRLDVVRLDLPPLRDRPEDVPALATHALALAVADGGPPRTLAPDALASLAAYHWPGNVRELLNEVRRAALTCPGDMITADDLSPAVRAPRAASPPGAGPPRTLEAVEREAIVQALAATGGNRSRAAELLGIPRTTLYRRLHEFGLIAPENPAGGDATG